MVETGNRNCFTQDCIAFWNRFMEIPKTPNMLKYPKMAKNTLFYWFSVFYQKWAIFGVFLKISNFVVFWGISENWHILVILLKCVKMSFFDNFRKS